MKNRFILIFLLSALVNSLMAQKISVQEIHRAVNNAFDMCANTCAFSGTESSMDSWKIAPIPAPPLNPALFICIRSEGGFVILSGDLSAEPVIAFSRTGTINPADLPPGSADWLETIRLQIEWIRTNKIEATPEIRYRWKVLLSEKTPDRTEKVFFSSGNSKKQSSSISVEPLITTKWGQRYPYNQFCPVDPASPDGHAVTGCAATALAQVMAYYNYPKHGTGSNSYYHPVYGWISADFSGATYNWEIMFDSVSAYWPMYAMEAPALISYHSGVAMNMNYGPYGSGVVASQILQHMIDHFGYNPESEYCWRIDYSDSDWVSLLQQQLDAGYPLVYRGTSTAGHVFICDGYQNDEYFHFNWGWSGNADGYFYINNLNPLGYNFNEGNYIFRDFFPAIIAQPYCQECDTLDYSMAIINDGSGPLNNYQENSRCTWLINPKTIERTTSINIHFRYFDIDPVDDTLMLFTGDPDFTAPAVGFSGNEIPADVALSSDSVWVVFLTGTNGVTGKGWELMYSTDGINVSRDERPEISNGYIKISPNPASDIATLELSDTSDEVSSMFRLDEKGCLKVFDLYGNKYIEHQVSGLTFPLKWDVNDWPEGMYILKLDFNSRVMAVGKMLVAR